MTLSDNPMRTPRFKHTANLSTLYNINAGGNVGTRIEVVGDSDNAAYEWIIRNADGSVQAHSDDAYGIPEVALRDALIAYYQETPTSL
jgi:hypothetical protein